ncbi:MAG: hypothetical protein AB4426_15285 [Xenococcaceae cyanobacterium]
MAVLATMSPGCCFLKLFAIKNYMTIMLAFLPCISLILLLFIFQDKNNDWRNSLLSALIVWGVGLTAITEALSLFRLLQFEWLIASWLFIDIFLIIIYFRSGRKNARKSNNQRINNIFKLSFFSIILLSGVTFIITTVGLVAIVAAPNNWDSMIYHMTRVAHWVQNHSIAHYPTHTIKQLYQNPWAEFAIMHFQILSRGDRFANLIQWSSMVSSIFGVSLIASQLGANLRGQILSTVVCATIPMGILQGSSTQNDYVVALWLVCLAYFTLLIVKEGASIANTSRVGASLGLAILTKGTAYIYGVPFCIWLTLWGIKKLRWQLWKPVIIVLIIVLAINFGHYTRNFTLFGSPLGVSGGYTNEVFSMTIFISNVTRNLALHADIVRNIGLQNIITPTTGITEKLIKILHLGLGLDVSDSRTTSPPGANFHVSGLSMHEDTAGNPVHLLLILLSFIFLITNRKLRRQPYLLSYFWAVSAGFFLFCFLLTWSPWRSRLHLPLFILFSALVGVVFSKSLNYRITNFLGCILILLSHSWVLNNAIRPLVGSNNIFNTTRIEQYFESKPYLKIPYIEAVEIAKYKKCSNIGLIGDKIDYEYPLWVLFNEGDGQVRIRHVNVTNESAPQANQYPYIRFKACAIISVMSEKNKKEIGKEVVTKSGIYHQYWSEGTVQVFTRQ